jgi:hypothetical protein
MTTTYAPTVLMDSILRRVNKNAELKWLDANIQGESAAVATSLSYLTVESAVLLAVPILTSPVVSSATSLSNSHRMEYAQ